MDGAHRRRTRSRGIAPPCGALTSPRFGSPIRIMGDRRHGVAFLVGGSARMNEEYSDALERRFAHVARATSYEHAVERLDDRANPLSFALVDIDSIQGAAWVVKELAERVETPLVF